MTQEELDKVLENHLHWIREDCEGWEYMRAVLDGKNLDGLYFDDAVLDWVSLKGASLNGASLNGASLNYAHLDGAVLDYASLDGAMLGGVSLVGASLYRASLNGTSLDEASLVGAINFPFIPIACPDAGSFIGWKKARRAIIKLEIPADAKRCSATTNKCRCNKAKVLEIQNLDGSISDITEIASNYDINFIYKVGEIVSVEDFCDDRWRECSQGIHFFVNRQSAVEY